MAYSKNPVDLGESDGSLKEGNPDTANIVYILYLVAIIVGLTAVVGVIMAYVNRSEASTWLETHYRYQIRTFWIGLLYSLISAALMPVFFIGFVLAVLALIWWIARCAVGMKYLGRREPLPNPASWLLT